jgi:hypothetical protein
MFTPIFNAGEGLTENPDCHIVLHATPIQAGPPSLGSIAHFRAGQIKLSTNSLGRSYEVPGHE